jgi:hypothetical protein
VPQKGNNPLKNFLKFQNSKINKNKKKIKVQNIQKNFNIPIFFLNFKISKISKKIKKFHKIPKFLKKIQNFKISVSIKFQNFNI